MNISIQGGHSTPEVDLPNHVKTRLYFAVGRFSARILRVHVRLTDENAEKGGIDKRCRMLFSFKDGDEVVVDKAACDWAAAVNAAAACAGRIVGRAVRLDLQSRRIDRRKILS